MKLLVMIGLSTLLGMGVDLDTTNLNEMSVGVQINGSEELTLIPGEKFSYSAGEGVMGYKSKLTIKSDATATKIKQGANLVFYVRTSSKANNFVFSCTKMQVADGKKIVQSKEGMTDDKDIRIKSIAYKAEQVDKANNIYKITLNEAPGLGVWCLSFKNAANGKFVMGPSIGGKEAFCFEITE